MPREIRPPELAALVDLSERPRAERWSLRAALTRYAQPEPQRVSDLLDLVRRMEFALADHLNELEQHGPALWTAVQGGDADATDGDELLVGLLRAMQEVDRLGDALATWAVDRAGERPDAAVDAVIADVRHRLRELGVPEQSGPPRPARAGGRRRG